MSKISVYWFLAFAVFCKVVLIKGSNWETFSLSQNLSVISNVNLISSLKAPSQLNCLVSCNLNSGCLSAEFKQDGRCLLFNKIFNFINETVSSNNSNLFQKNGKINLNVLYYFI